VNSLNQLQIFNTNSISRNTMHRQSYNLQATVMSETMKS